MLIGNSRWHWAEKYSKDWSFSHTSPDPSSLTSVNPPLSTWAAVGPIPAQIAFDFHNRLNLQDVPLTKVPPWLGIDRALAAWGALIRIKQAEVTCSGLLVADAGTVLSLTRVTSKGEFQGGQLIAGLRLQLSAMAKGAKNLNNPGLDPLPAEVFPIDTAHAMRQGAIQALVGVITQAQREANVPIWLCGGDAPILADVLRGRGLDVTHHPNLALEGLIDLDAQINKDQGLQ